MSFMTPEQFKRMQEETKQMDLTKKWIDTFQKMDMSRQQSGFGNAINTRSDPMDKAMQMMEKKHEMEMMTNMMKDVFKGDSVDEKKSSSLMDSLSSLIKTDPEGAKEFLSNLDENTISKISLLSNPDPNAQVLRSLLTKGKDSDNSLNGMFELFTKMLALQKTNEPKSDPSQQMMMMMMKTMMENSSKPVDNSQNQLMIEMMRSQAETARENARISEERAREENQKFNQLMITVMNEKVQESRNSPGLIDQLGQLGESMNVLKGMGMGGETRTLEELKLSHEQEKWRMEQQMARGQQDMWRGIAEQGLDRLADVMSNPAMQQFAQAASGNVGAKIQAMQSPSHQQVNPQSVPQRQNVDNLNHSSPEPLNPTELVTFNNINEQEIPINVPYSSHVFGDNKETQ